MFSTEINSIEEFHVYVHIHCALYELDIAIELCIMLYIKLKFAGIR